ncbi:MULTISPECIES: RNA-guided endonuclease InsQ/TnpB family protein [unclassified Streptomyces]|uniref:RNA-guided endonuclease InsQ/TnpB family protein n=1 Tax=unclassified Streptomyces TaxID=2593676 RepID=UPI002E2D23A7|nr:transposase [Streptomyces sp. NBC_01439]
MTGDEARHVKRELLGVGDRTKHRARAGSPLESRTRPPGTQQRVYRFRFYPTADQAAQLRQTFGACRWVYNEGLALRAKAWEDHRVSLGFAETCRALTGWKRVPRTAWLAETSSTVLQQALRHLDSAFSRFFKGTARHPRRKSKHRPKESATYVRTGFRWIEDPQRPGTASVTLAKQPVPLDVRWSRALPPGLSPVKLTVTRDRADRYFLSVLVEEVIAGCRPQCPWSPCKTDRVRPRGRTRSGSGRRSGNKAKSELLCPARGTTASSITAARC